MNIFSFLIISLYEIQESFGIKRRSVFILAKNTIEKPIRIRSTQLFLVLNDINFKVQKLFNHKKTKGVSKLMTGVTIKI